MWLSLQRGRGRPGRQPRPDGEADGEYPEDEHHEGDANGLVNGGAEGEARGRGGRRARGRGRGGRGGARAAAAEGEEGAAEGAEGVPRTRAPRAPKPPRRTGPPTGEPSKTLLFVANLPFNVDDAALTKIFTDEGLTVTSAHVVRKKFGPKRKPAGTEGDEAQEEPAAAAAPAAAEDGPIIGRSKGFGFVEVKDETEQKKAVEVLNGKAIDGREIQVKVAINEAEDEKKAEQEGEKPAEANGVTA